MGDPVLTFTKDQSRRNYMRTDLDLFAAQARRRWHARGRNLMFWGFVSALSLVAFVGWIMWILEDP